MITGHRVWLSGKKFQLTRLGANRGVNLTSKWHNGSPGWKPKAWWSALQGKDRGEREGVFTEGTLLNVYEGLADEGAFVIVMSDGTGVE